MILFHSDVDSRNVKTPQITLLSILLCISWRFRIAVTFLLIWSNKIWYIYIGKFQEFSTFSRNFSTYPNITYPDEFLLHKTVRSICGPKQCQRLLRVFELIFGHCKIELDPKSSSKFTLGDHWEKFILYTNLWERLNKLKQPSIN